MMNTTPTNKRLGICLHDASTMFGSQSLVKDCVAANWFTPVVQRGRLTLYPYQEVLKAWERISNGELPPRRKATASSGPKQGTTATSNPAA